MATLLGALEPPLYGLITAMVAFFTGAGGYWTYLKARREKLDKEKDAANRLLMGIGHNRIVTQGMTYVHRGWVTNAEFQDLKHYLFEPYAELGGNGTAERIIHAVERLPFEPDDKIFETPIRSTDRYGHEQSQREAWHGYDRRGTRCEPDSGVPGT